MEKRKATAQRSEGKGREGKGESDRRTNGGKEASGEGSGDDAVKGK